MEGSRAVVVQPTGDVEALPAGAPGLGRAADAGLAGAGEGAATSTPAGRGRSRPPATLLVLGGVVSVQVGAALAKGLFPTLGPAGTVFLRLAVGALALCLVARSALRLTRAQLRPAILFGAVLALMNLTFYSSLSRIPLSVAVTVEFLGPLGVAIAGSRRLRDVLWAVLAGIGVLTLTDGGTAVLSGRLDPLGVALAAVAGACWAGYILLSQRVGAAVPGVSGLAVAMAVGALLVAPLGVLQGGAALLEPRFLLLGAAVGVLSAAVPFALEMAALRRLAASTFGVLMSTEPAVAALAGLLLLHEGLDVAAAVGIALVCVAAAGATRSAGAAGTAVRDG